MPRSKALGEKVLLRQRSADFAEPFLTGFGYTDAGSTPNLVQGVLGASSKALRPRNDRAFQRMGQSVSFSQRFAHDLEGLHCIFRSVSHIGRSG